MFNSIWYNSLTKPPFAPPAWVFAPAWTFLYITIFVSLILYFITPAQNKKEGYLYFSIQLVLNFLWVPAFFGLKNMALALLLLILTDIFTIFTVKKFYFVSKVASAILLPYLLWLIFATYLNFGYLILNIGS